MSVDRLALEPPPVFLADPLDNFGHEQDEAAPREMPFLRGIWWAFCIINGPRGVGGINRCYLSLPSSCPCRFPKCLHAHQKPERLSSFLVSGIALDISSSGLMLDIPVLQTGLLAESRSRALVGHSSGTRNVLSIRAQGPLIIDVLSQLLVQLFRGLSARSACRTRSWVWSRD
jgi:hypothetical protein